MSAHQVQEQQRREELLTQLAILEREMSLNRAAKVLGESPATLSRYRKLYAEGGRAALLPKTDRCGARPLVTLNGEELREAQALYVETGSKTCALRMFASSSEIARDEVIAAIMKERRSKHTLTATLRRQLDVPEAVKAFHKSPKQTGLNFFINPRTMTYTGPDGREHDLEAGDLFERDDMSNNFLCTVEWPWGGDPCSEKYGVRLARGQNLVMIDARTLRFPSFCFVVRPRDSYRADDIWNWVGQTYRDIGMPAIGERWERGIWEARKLNGEEIACEAGHTEDAVRVGGIQALGRRIIRSYKPTSKLIEGRFNFLQRVMATIPGQIGRNRGEMERETKLWMECRAGRRDPREFFLGYAEACARIEAALHYCNAEKIEGEKIYGIPDRLWAEGGAEERLRRLSPEQTYLFSRDKREVTILKGHARVRHTKDDGRRDSWWFWAEELYRYEGRPAHVFFDSNAPAEGATVAIGGALIPAELVSGTPQFSLAVTGERGESANEALDRRRLFADAVRSEYRALGLGGRRLAQGSRAADGRGQEAACHSTPFQMPPAQAALGSVRGAGLGGPGSAAAGGASFRHQPEADAAELDRLEREAIARGDILVT